VGISPQAWSKIPEDLREPFLRAVKEGADLQRQYLVEANEEATLKLQEFGVTIYDIDRTQLQDAYAEAKRNALAKFDPEWVALTRKAIDAHK